MDEKIAKFFEKDLFAAHSGAKITDAGTDYAVVRMDIQPYHLNAAGTVQGGAIFTLCDFAFAVAVNSRSALTVSIDADIKYFRAPSGSFIVAKAQVISASRKLATGNVDVFDENGTFVARYCGTGYIKGDKLEFSTSLK